MPSKLALRITLPEQLKQKNSTLIQINLPKDPRPIKNDWAPVKKATPKLWKKLREIKPELRGQRMGLLLVYEHNCDARLRFLVEPAAQKPVEYFEYNGVVEFVLDSDAACEEFHAAAVEWARSVKGGVGLGEGEGEAA
ncbi:uncharacterized protein BO97DRAFT_421999 [Aspergillus homomorphus CBS 101889]|uniref:Uncharacterized protein n=1 Tax=Aspergillus homomorphus (strain CBS 101889) TaxID=1450537 RepID=A0A395I819_ASPHC|nr:hypothetical protein BO97DRAFT_421999 [Aspergillus homomorphus CBS 101889]RAL15208.1 hypothetical protein BO97DRAFT_421999 [Aspergillus homomorphus CBS 101889]